jgi:dethiobiotin synthetase
MPPHQPQQFFAPIFVAATREHVGKTSVSLALMSGLVKRFGRQRVGFIKPVGQKWLPVTEDVVSGTNPTTTTQHHYSIDKDAVLIKSHFRLDELHWPDTSPIVIKEGYTKSYLDNNDASMTQTTTVTNNNNNDSQEQQPQQQQQLAKIMTAYENIRRTSDVVLCEGTGHCAVGSIIDASNAAVARHLQAKMILVANGGVGNTFDELDLNWNYCNDHDVPIAGIIINQIQIDIRTDGQLSLEGD